MQGINQPLLMPIQSAWSWLTSAYNKKTGEIVANDRAKSQLINTWQGGAFQSPECDSYYERLYPELTDELIEQIIHFAKQFLLPILLHQVTVE